LTDASLFSGSAAAERRGRVFESEGAMAGHAHSHAQRVRYDGAG
jgi:hypothetical protein